MKKLSLFLLLLICAPAAISQNSKLWKSYFSYNEIKDLSESPNRIVAAAENALFSKDLISGSIKTTNTLDGLSGMTISSIYYSPTYRKTLVGYENGLMIVINEIDGSMLNVVDIINKALPPTIKRINHFMEYEGIVYISCDFGIVQYNLRTLLFGDTYFIGNGGSQIVVKQTAILNGMIYAATFVNGIRSASITNPNLNDFNQWTTLDANGWTGIEAIGTNMYAVSNTGFLYTWDGTNFSSPAGPLEVSTDMRKSGDYLVITTANHVYIYNSSMALVRNLLSSEITDEQVKFSCATVVNDKIYAGTAENGLYTTPLQSSTFVNMSPPGALRNAVFGINATTPNLWVVYGGYSQVYDPYRYFGSNVNTFGMSYFNQGGWKHIPYEELLGAKALVHVTVNPNNINQVFVSSFNKGLLKIENFQPTILYDESNTGSDGLSHVDYPNVPNDVRINGTAFDKAGNLWMNNSLAKKSLKVFQTNNTWKSYNTDNLPINKFTYNLSRLVVDKNGTKWMGSYSDGVIAFNEAVSPTVFKTLRSSDAGNIGGLPSNNIKAVAIDQNNQLWIGGTRGLRVLSSVDNFYSSQQMNAENIVITEYIDGVPVYQELLLQQSISDIVVDGANNKWIATTDSGAYMVSPDGQQTFYHFTTSNSPLPSNNINDIDINGATGEVFFATTNGMVSFKATATDPNADLNNVFIYPNPVRPNFYGTVKVSGLMDKAHVKIADIQGSLVHEAIAEGGTIEWDTTAFGKYKVASGVYMVFISSEDGSKTKVKKVMIVR